MRYSIKWLNSYLKSYQKMKLKLKFKLLNHFYGFKYANNGWIESY